MALVAFVFVFVFFLCLLWFGFALVWLPIAFLSAGQLYQSMADSYVAGYYSSTATQRLSAAFSSLKKGASYYLYNSPQVAVLLPSQNFYQYLPITEDIVLGAETLPVLAAGGTDYVVVDADAYAKDIGRFSRYRPLSSVERYEILEQIPIAGQK